MNGWMYRAGAWSALLLMLGCSAGKYQPRAELQTVDGREMLVGEIAYQDILHYFPEWQVHHQEVTLNPEEVRDLRKIESPLEVVCYLGTWCGDSREGVPPFMKAVRAADNPNLTVEIIAVNRQKNDPPEAVANDIQRVPTFLVRENGKEIGRLVEFPLKENFVEDLLMLLNLP